MGRKNSPVSCRGSAPLLQSLADLVVFLMNLVPQGSGLLDIPVADRVVLVDIDDPPLAGLARIDGRVEMDSDLIGFVQTDDEVGKQCQKPGRHRQRFGLAGIAVVGDVATASQAVPVDNGVVVRQRLAGG